jgi:hypothetical protein
VEAMISDVLATIGLIVQQVKQTPITVQLTPPPDPWWRWLLPTIVQTVISLASISAGVLIAIWSFRANRKTEHEQWVRDEKKAEWRELLDVLSEGQDPVQLVAVLEKQPYSGATASAEGYRTNVYNKVRRVQQVLDDRMFIQRKALTPVINLWLKARENARTTEGTEYSPIYALTYVSLIDCARQAARNDLSIQDQELDSLSSSSPYPPALAPHESAS